VEYKNQKLNYCQKELKALLEKLMAGNYEVSARTVFDHLAHTGVDTDLDKTLKEKPTFEEFMGDR